MTGPTSPSAPSGAVRGRLLLVAGVVLIVVAVGVLAYGFTRGGDGDADSSTTVASSVPMAGSTAEPTEGGLLPLDQFEQAAVTITGPDGDTCVACMALADTADTRSQGLMEVTDPDLAGFDGMLFRYDEPVDGAFWMRNTRLPLSIAYLDADGAFVSSTDMEPCPDSSSDSECPRYPADGPFAYAVEVPLGGLADLLLVPGSSLRVEPGPCPLA